MGALSPSDSDSVGPVSPTGLLSSSVFECAGPVGPSGTVLPGDEEKGLFPIVPNPVITQLPTDMLVRDCGDIVNRDVTGNSCWAVREGIGDPAVVDMIGLDAMSMGEGIQLHGADKCV